MLSGGVILKKSIKRRDYIMAGFRKKSVIIIAILALFLVSCASSEAEKPDIMGKIQSSPAVKLEYTGDEPLMIDNDLTAIRGLSSLAIHPAGEAGENAENLGSTENASSDEASGETSGSDGWIYRFTYDPEEKVINGSETVALFYKDMMYIDGTAYVPDEGVSYDSILEWAENTYGYYSGQ